jgi:peptide chain release factor 2
MKFPPFTAAWPRCGGFFDVDLKRKRLAELEAQSTDPAFWNDSNRARETIAATNQIKGTLGPFDQLQRDLEDAGAFVELAQAEPEGPARESVEKELASLLLRMGKACHQLELKTLLAEKFDYNNAYISLNAGAGGTESQDWADMLLRMYQRFATSRNFEFTILDIQPGEEAGIKSMTALVSGPYAYGTLKSERGVHRLVRISPFDANQRRHTSFTALDVVAEVDDNVDVQINDADLRIDVYRASGAGGQHVNKTESAVRMTHMPTGIVVQCQSERSQHTNRDKAMKMLISKIYDFEMDQKKKEMERFYQPKGAIAWGSQIRSYVLQPYQMVKDHRTDHETSNTAAVLDGDLDGFVEAWLKDRKKSGEQHS